MIAYIKAKKAAKEQQKIIEERLEADKKENERMGKLLSKYFDFCGRGLTKAQIREVNNYLKEYVVLSDEQEINTYTSMMLTYSTVAKRKLAEIIEEITNALDRGEIINKSDAGMVAKNVIINKGKIVTTRVVNGQKTTEVIMPEKKYVVNINANSTPAIQSTKYENECEEVMRNIDNQISKWSHVSTLAYMGFKDTYSL